MGDQSFLDIEDSARSPDATRMLICSLPLSTILAEMGEVGGFFVMSGPDMLSSESTQYQGKRYSRRMMDVDVVLRREKGNIS